MSINDRIRTLAHEANADAVELRELLVTLSERLRIHLDDVVAGAEDLRAAFEAHQLVVVLPPIAIAPEDLGSLFTGAPAWGPAPLAVATAPIDDPEEA